MGSFKATARQVTESFLSLEVPARSMDQEEHEERSVLEGEITDEDVERSYLPHLKEKDGYLDATEFEYVKKTWEDLEPDDRAALRENLTDDQYHELRREYGRRQGGHRDRSFDPDVEGMDEERFEEVYEDWEKLEQDAKQEYWRSMNGEQKARISREYAASWGESGEDIEDWMVPAEEWNRKPAEEREELWHSGDLTYQEREHMVESDEYTLKGMAFDPAQYEGERWHNTLTTPEKKTVIQDEEYEPEDFGYEPYTRYRSDAGSRMLGLIGAGVGSGVGFTITHPMIASGNPEAMMAGAGIQLLSSIGGYGVGSTASEIGQDMAGKDWKTEHYTFADDEVQEAWNEYQAREEAEPEGGPTGGAEDTRGDEPADWDVLGKVRYLVMRKEQDGEDPAREP